jgi:four helix bundle protein
MKESIVKNKRFEFALKVIELYKFLHEQKEFILSKQLLRSGTSIGANINEALAGVSKADFTNKMCQ